MPDDVQNADVKGESTIENSYSPQIETNAAKYGYKAANLLELQRLVKEFEHSDAGKELTDLYPNLKIDIPAFSPLDGDLIKNHLELHEPEWKNIFIEFQQEFNVQENQSNLGKKAIASLEKLQNIIRNCFETNPISAEQIDSFLQSAGLELDSLLMIRSTGIHEDKADLANPGGNESLPAKANIIDISKAIGEVAASYVGAKSLSQRLIAGDQNITEFPVMPVLIQKMIGASKESAVCSGVVYSGDGVGSRIQAAPGAGEYVVNSKGAVDNYYVSSQGVVYAEVRPKEFRLAPNFDERERKIKLERIENPGKLQYASALNEGQATYLDAFAKFLEQQYAKRMDVEFVYDLDSKTINIVQARAIPEGNRKGLTPSAVSPEFLGKYKDQLTTIDSSQVITPDVNKASVIIDKNQLIITQTIEQALSEYNKLGKGAGILGGI